MSEALIRQVAILVGGKGTRLGELTREVPKPLLPIANERAFLDYLIEMVARHGYADIMLLAGHLADRVEEAYQGRRLGDATIRVLREHEPLGTGGALTTARDALDEQFILMNGDTLFDINLRALEASARGGQAVATIALRVADDVSRYGRVLTDGARVTRFLEKDPGFHGPGTINGGVYVLKRTVLDLIDRLPCSIEQDIFPRLVEFGMIRGEIFDGCFLDIGIPAALELGHRKLPKLRVRPAAFFDRDGVLNVDHGYTFRPGDLEFVPGAVEAVRRLNDRGYLVIVVSNQAAIARGYCTIEDVNRFNRAMQEQLFRHGAHVDQFYVAPYHPEGKIAEYAIDHVDRKPGPGMLLRAFVDWPIDKERSFLIGDKETDIRAAENAGIVGYLYAGGDLNDFVDNLLAKQVLTTIRA